MDNMDSELPDNETDGQEELPPPINMSSNAGKNSALEQGTITPMGWKATVKEPLPPIRCTGTVRNGLRKGERCGKWSLAGSTVCMVHGGHLPNVKEHAQKNIETARMRLLGMADEAIDTLEELLQPGTAAQVRLGAVKEILDRGGIVKDAPDLTVEVNHNVNPSELINERLKSISDRLTPKEDPEEEMEEIIYDEED